MTFPLDGIIRFIAAVMTLEPGDVVGAAVEESGRLRNLVVAAESNG